MRVALVVGPDPGHLVPVAGLAAQLVAAGHEALVVTSDRWRVPLERDGLPWLALPLIARAVGDEDMGRRLHVRSVQMGVPLAAALRGLGLDLVVSDTLTRAGAVAAALLNLPWVELIPHPLPDPSVALPPFGTGWRPRPRRDRRWAARTERSRALGEQQRRDALAQAGVPDVGAAHRLVATLPALEPLRPDWPAATTLVAPPTWEPADADLPVSAGSDPLLLVVGSTASSGGSADLLAATLASVRGWRVASPRFGPYPGPLPVWATAGPGRLGPLLAQADAVLAPGGHGLVAASLRAGVPLVLVPGGGDQKEVSARAARTGGAVRLRRARPGALRRALAGTAGRAAAAAVAGDIGGLPPPVPLLLAAAR